MVKYLLAWDGSESARKALTFLARQFRPSVDKLIILHAFQSAADALLVETAASVGGIPDLPALSDVRREAEKRRQDTMRDLHEAVRLFAGESLGADTAASGAMTAEEVLANVEMMALETGDIRAALCERAADEKVDVIVMGTRGMGLVKRLLLGSVSTYVVENAPCSVMVVR